MCPIPILECKCSLCPQLISAKLGWSVTHNKAFYDFLIDSFQDTPGLSLVLAQRFRVMNGYNDYPISPGTWRAVIQPKTKITMAMLVLNSNVVKEGKCADPSCSGGVSFTIENPTCVW